MLTLIVIAGAVLTSAAYLLLRLSRQIAWLSNAFVRLPASQKAVLVLGVTIATVSAQKGGTSGVDQAVSTNSGEAASSPLVTNLITTLHLPTVPLSLVTVTAEDVARGYRLETVSANPALSYAMPPGATVVGTWHLSGAYEDVLKIGIGEQGTGDGGWNFPLGSNEYDSVWAYTWGKIRPRLRDTSNEIAAVGAPMSAIPGLSRFWTAATTNDSYLLTWEDFATGRISASTNACSLFPDPCSLVSAQIELSPGGDFVTRSNGVESVYRRIDPEDWDGDGWRNGDDSDPYVWNESWDDFWQELPTGANTNAYSWIDVRCDYNSSVWFSGDGDSDLPDPLFMARAGRTYRVVLLIGKTYEIESVQPLTVVAKSNGDIEVDGNGTCDLTVVWPVDLYARESNGRGFRMIVNPSGLGGRFTWASSCCTVYGGNDIFRYGCNGNCGCSGCYATGRYSYEGYWLYVEGGWCGCDSYYDDDPDDNDPPGASVSFSKNVIFLEDEYANTSSNIVSWQSTDTLLTCEATGGANGGYVTFSIAGDANLIQYTGNSLPYSRSLAPNETLHFVNRYKATAESSSADDIVVTATFVENGTGWSDTSEATATAVKVEIEPLITVNNALHRHTLGVREEILVNLSPSGMAMIETGEDWNVLQYSSSTHYQCPITAATRGITVKAGGASYEPALQIIEPEGIICGNVTAETYGLSSGHAGGIGMWMPLHVTPSMVSFSNVAMVEEVTDSGSATGYFTNPIFSGSYSHSVANGAGVWHNIAGENYFFDDHPAMMGECPSPWSYGSIIWEIPIAWGERNSYRVVDKISNIPYQAQQTFTIDPQGGVKMEKFGYWVKRAAGGLVAGSANVIGL